MLEYLIFNASSIICVTSGAYLCYKEKDGWGWFLFVALLLSRFPDLTPT